MATLGATLRLGFQQSACPNTVGIYADASGRHSNPENQVPKVSIIADSEFVGALADDHELPLTQRERVRGTVTESERLGFELGSVETMIGYIAAGIELIVIARHLLAAARHSSKPKLEIASPTGRVSVDLDGKTDYEVAELIKAALPFTR